MAEATTRQSDNMIADMAKRTARVPSAWTGKPRMSLKSVNPLFPPNPMSLRKKASISA
ncbi:Uncharacterised protein [Mycobacterium tuberculosis]|nr:Uncharacterised protein [Mycobacterium tuberculosis]